ncbi:hypothetical protein ABEB36_007574 [Hypothenemus hampei]|uniref:Uncharacterized protein n=1 Tax=Hypothenemus hampei TaxID=57062 RepID=A0ABD1EV19_HYPHA
MNKTSRCNIPRPCPAPKRLLTSSNWILRNDSSNINAILHPNESTVPLLKFNEKTRGDVIVKKIINRTKCYCRCKSKKLTKPTLFQRPKSCIICDCFEDKSTSECHCEDDDYDQESSPESLIFRVRKLKGRVPAGVALKYSEHRKKYEDYLRMREQELQKKIRIYDSSSGSRVEKLGFGDGKVNTILGPHNIGTTTSLFNSGFQSLKSHNGNHEKYGSDGVSTDQYPAYSEQSIPNFRQEHYFETHDIGKYNKISGESSKEHACVHQFILDNKQLPEALNKDIFGRSLCKICNKPMEGSSLNLSSGLFDGDRLSKYKITNYANMEKKRLYTTTVNLGKGKSKIELLLTPSDVKRLSSYICKTKKPVYRNSLALRHQKLSVV